MKICYQCIYVVGATRVAGLSGFGFCERCHREAHLYNARHAPPAAPVAPTELPPVPSFGPTLSYVGWAIVGMSVALMLAVLLLRLTER